MSNLISREDAWKLLTKYNQEPFHLKHALVMESVMKYFARELGYEDEEEFWGRVGLLHDLDFEQSQSSIVLSSRKLRGKQEFLKILFVQPAAMAMELPLI